jgi:hypothetical protein
MADEGIVKAWHAIGPVSNEKGRLGGLRRELLTDALVMLDEEDGRIVKRCRNSLVVQVRHLGALGALELLAAIGVLLVERGEVDSEHRGEIVGD